MSPARPADRQLDRIGEACQRYVNALGAYRAMARDFAEPRHVRPGPQAREVIELWAIEQIQRALTELTTLLVDKGSRRPPGGLT